MGDAMSGGCPRAGASNLGFNDADMGTPMVSLRGDEEFTQFFEQTKKNDALIDKYVDDIGAGVKTSAPSRRSWWCRTLLAEKEEKVDSIDKNLKGLNKKPASSSYWASAVVSTGPTPATRRAATRRSKGQGRERPERECCVCTLVLDE